MNLARASSCVLLALIASCAGTTWPWGTTQRWPKPMENAVDPLPPGEVVLEGEEGPEEVLIVRHADPVRVRPTGLIAGYPLTFYDKSVRVHAGSAVRVASGGRAEILWPNGNSIVIFDEGGGVIGSPSKGESCFNFLLVTLAHIELRENEQVELIGGARLRAQSGPFVLEHVRPEILRVSNQSKAAGEIAFREEVFALDPGAVIDLALLELGGKPIKSDMSLSMVQGPGFGLSYGGAIDVVPGPDGIDVHALGEHEVSALGVRVRLERDEEASFRGTPSKKRP